MLLDGFHQKDQAEKETDIVQEVPKQGSLLESYIGEWTQE
jgi:hypothetical protein